MPSQNNFDHSLIKVIYHAAFFIKEKPGYIVTTKLRHFELWNKKRFFYYFAIKFANETFYEKDTCRLIYSRFAKQLVSICFVNKFRHYP